MSKYFFGEYRTGLEVDKSMCEYMLPYGSMYQVTFTSANFDYAEITFCKIIC